MAGIGNFGLRGGGRWRGAATGAGVLGLVVAVLCAGMAVLLMGARSDWHPQRPISDVTTDIGEFVRRAAEQPPIGALVYFNHIRLVQGPSPRLYFARDDNGGEIAVIWDAGETRTEDGAFANVMGVVSRLPGLATLTKQWKLGKEEAQALRRQGIYVQADRVWADD